MMEMDNLQRDERECSGDVEKIIERDDKKELGENSFRVYLGIRLARYEPADHKLWTIYFKPPPNHFALIKQARVFEKATGLSVVKPSLKELLSLCREKENLIPNLPDKEELHMKFRPNFPSPLLKEYEITIKEV